MSIDLLWTRDNPNAGRRTGGMYRAIRDAQPVASFRIYCDHEKKGKYYHVVVLRRRADLPAVARAVTFNGRGGWHRTRGFCHALEVLVKTKCGWRPTRLAGYVVIPQRCVSAGVVSHEMTHAAHFRLADGPLGKLLLGDRRVLEPLAYLQGWLVAQFWTEYYNRFPDLKLVPKQKGWKTSA